MKNILNRFSRLIYKILGSTKFFVFSLVLFGLHCLWLALSAVSLPYDEYYHLGIIEFYSHQWSPFIAHQPASVSYLGDITRLPSYLYHYLMSFPYRFFATFISSQYTLTIIMRLVNISLVIGGLILFRRLMLKLDFSKRVTHLSLFVFMMLPMVVYLASESNYDNLMFLLTPIFLTLALYLARGKITIQNLFVFVSLGLLTILVKDEFIVVFGLVCVGVIYFVIKNVGLKAGWQKLKASFIDSKKYQLVLVTALLVLSCGLFAERYGLNLVRYRSVNINCIKVQPESVCSQYSPWNRNNYSKANPPGSKLYNSPISYTKDWVVAMVQGAVSNFSNVPAQAQAGDPYGNYEFMGFLPLMIKTAWILLTVAAVFVIIGFKKWWTDKMLRTIVIFCFGYVLALWLYNYHSYLDISRAYAIQPRYLLPILILMLAGGMEMASRVIKNRHIKSSAAALIVIIFVYSGGAFGWFIYANRFWYWPNQKTISINQSIQNVLSKIILR